jgi:hypothetical protein
VLRTPQNHVVGLSLATTEVSDEYYDGLKLLSMECWTGLSPSAFVEAADIVREAIFDLNCSAATQ